jgi:DNA-binding LytR/AlgR family response regulator
MITALIAEDEPLLAAELQAQLAQVWPDLTVLGTASDGHSAVEKTLLLKPDVLFIDIRMPGQTGLEAAAELADAWPESGTPFPALVFVSAYDQYAVVAFEAQAVDYLLKPVQIDRLRQTCVRLQATLIQRSTHWPQLVKQLQTLLNSAMHNGSQSSATQAKNHVQPPLQMLQASQGNQLRMVPVSDVLRLEAADKYVRVLTLNGTEVLLRTPLKELMQRLDPLIFWQIHRGSVVRATSIESVTRDETGRMSLRLAGQTETLPVSRLYGQQFRSM